MSTLPAQAIAAAADRQFYIDMTVLDLVSFDGTTTIDVYGQVETSKWAIGRLKGDTTAPGDLGPSQRNIQWKKETGSFTGFDQTTGSLFQKAHALGSQWLMNCEDAADTGDKYTNELARVDYNMNARNNLFFTFRRNNRLQYVNQVLGDSNPALGDYLSRINTGGTAADVYTIRPTLIGETLHSLRSGSNGHRSRFPRYQPRHARLYDNQLRSADLSAHQYERHHFARRPYHFL